MNWGSVEKISDFSFVLRIDDFLDVLMRPERDSYSPEFIFRGASWYINLLKYEFESRHLVQFLPLPVRDPDKLHRHGYSLRIRGKMGSDYWRHCSHWGDSHELLQEDLERDICEIAPEGVLTIVLSFDLPDPIDPAQRARSLTQALEWLLQTSYNSDMTLSVKGQTFNVHRWILSHRCPILETAADLDVIAECEPDNFRTFLLYLYTGKSSVVSFENVTDLYKLGFVYNLEELQAICTEYVIKNLSTDSFTAALTATLEFGTSSRSFPDSTLGRSLLQFFTENIEQIIYTQDWKDFSELNPLISDILMDKALENMKSD